MGEILSPSWSEFGENPWGFPGAASGYLQEDSEAVRSPGGVAEIVGLCGSLGERGGEVVEQEGEEGVEEGSGLVRPFFFLLALKRSPDSWSREAEGRVTSTEEDLGRLFLPTSFPLAAKGSDRADMELPLPLPLSMMKRGEIAVKQLKRSLADTVKLLLLLLEQCSFGFFSLWITDIFFCFSLKFDFPDRPTCGEAVPTLF